MTAFCVSINKGKVTITDLKDKFKRKPMTRYELFLNKWRKRYQKCDMSTIGECRDEFDIECRKRFPDKYETVNSAEILSLPITR